MPIFFTKKFCNRGGGTTPQMPLTVKVYKFMPNKKIHISFIARLRFIEKEGCIHSRGGKRQAEKPRRNIYLTCLHMKVTASFLCSTQILLLSMQIYICQPAIIKISIPY